MALLRYQTIVLDSMFPAHGLVTLWFRAMSHSDGGRVFPFIHAIKTVYQVGESLYIERILYVLRGFHNKISMVQRMMQLIMSALSKFGMIFRF